jgi:probable rRNA maturation factor
MTIDLEVQVATAHKPLPTQSQVAHWVQTALGDRADSALVVRLVDRDESEALNARYREQHKPTNVLSFAAELPEEVSLPLLGDIVICAPLVAEEAAAQGKAEMDHWAHLVIHGVLHLLGHDHQEPSEAQRMESLEIEMLAQLGIADPYA